MAGEFPNGTRGFKHNDVMVRLRQIVDRREEAIEAAQETALLSLGILLDGVTATVTDGTEVSNRRGDIDALYAVFPDLMAARGRIYGRRPWGTAEFIGPVKKSKDSTVEHFAGGLLIAAEAWEHTVLGQVDDVDFRVEPGMGRESAVQAYYLGHEVARGSRPVAIGAVSA